MWSNTSDMAETRGKRRQPPHNNTSERIQAPLVAEREGVSVRVMGVHSLPYVRDTLLVEVMVNLPSQEVSAADFNAPSNIQEWSEDCGQYEFWLNQDGSELIGYWLDPPVQPAPTRFAFLLYGCPVPFTLTTPAGKVRIHRSTPVPPRLLHLIWIEDLA